MYVYVVILNGMLVFDTFIAKYSISYLYIHFESYEGNKVRGTVRNDVLYELLELLTLNRKQQLNTLVTAEESVI